MAQIAIVGDCCTQNLTKEHVTALTELFTDCDAFIMNLEGPVVDWPAPKLQLHDKLRRTISDSIGKVQPRLRTLPDELELLCPCPANVAMMANNHVLDYGGPAIAETLRHLEARAIIALGAGRCLAEALRTRVIEVAGHKIGLANYSAIGLEYPPGAQDYRFTLGLYAARAGCPGGAPLFLRRAKRDIALLRDRCELVIVGLHLGRDEMMQFRVGDLKRVNALLEAGADVVAVHHAHSTHPPYTYAGGIVAGLGDFVFQYGNRGSRSGSFIRVTFGDDAPSAEVAQVVDITAAKPITATIIKSTLNRSKHL